MEGLGEAESGSGLGRGGGGEGGERSGGFDGSAREGAAEMRRRWADKDEGFAEVHSEEPDWDWLRLKLGKEKKRKETKKEGRWRGKLEENLKIFLSLSPSTKWEIFLFFIFPFLEFQTDKKRDLYGYLYVPLSSLIGFAILEDTFFKKEVVLEYDFAKLIF